MEIKSDVSENKRFLDVKIGDRMYIVVYSPLDIETRTVSGIIHNDKDKTLTLYWKKIPSSRNVQCSNSAQSLNGLDIFMNKDDAVKKYKELMFKEIERMMEQLNTYK